MTQLSTSRYKTLRLLGEGGQGRVSLAYDSVREREVALKEILAEGASAAAFQQEFWWMTRLRHASLVEVLDYGTREDGKPYFTMEPVAGTPLDAVLPLPAERVREVLKQLCRVLRHVHAQGLVHGDLKPENIRVLDDGTIKLLDFGLMTPAGQAANTSGTPAFMAPEVIQQGRVDSRADLYALGVMAYQLLTGQLPFQDETASALLRAHLEEAPLPPSRRKRDLDPAWNKLILRLLAKDPLKRFQSAAEVLEALGEPVDDTDALLLVSPFVGRAELVARLEAAIAAHGGAIALLGTPGSGRSRLLDELAYKAQLAERLVFRGRSGVLAAPYEPFVQVLRQAWPELARTCAELLTLHGPALNGLVPELANASAYRLEPQEEKLRLQSALVELLTALARTRGLVLALDDWQHADPLSRELLAVLRRRLAPHRVLLVTAGDTAELDFEALTLAPLGRHEVARMAGAMLGVETLPEAFAAQIDELTGGQPSAIEGFLRHLVATRSLPRANGRWVLEPLPESALPAGLGDLVAARLDALAPLPRRLLAIAAALGREVPLALFERLTPEALHEARFEALAALVAEQWLALDETGYRATQPHAMARMLRALPHAERQRLHTEVGEALEEAEPTDALLLQLAHHFLDGDRAAKAVHYALEAAKRMITLYANDQARELLARGLALLDAQTEPSNAVRAEYTALLGDMHRSAAEYAHAARCYAEALERADASQTALRAHVLVGRGLLHQIANEFEAALASLAEALPLCRALSEALEELRCLATLGRVAFYAGDRPRSQATYEEALTRARDVGDLAYIGESLAFLGMLHVSAEPAGDAPRGLAYLEEAIAIKETIGDKRGLNDAYMLLGNALLALGDLPGADRSFSRNQAICQEIGACEDEIFSFLNLALLATERGDPLVALERVQRAAALAQPLDAAFLLGLAGCLEARALWQLGQLGKPLGMLEASLAEARAHENRYWELFALTYLIEAQIRLGAHEAAQQNLLEAIAAEADTGINEFALQLALFKAQLASRAGNPQAAEEAAQAAVARAEARGAQLAEAQACFALAELMVARDAHFEASRWLDRATERARVCDARGLEVECLLLAGCSAVARRQLNAAERHFERARGIAEELNLLDALARALHAQAALDFPSTQSARLLKRAQELMVQVTSELDGPQQAAYLASGDRYAVFMGEVGAPEAPEAAGEAPEAVAELRQVVLQQRVWIDELQQGCDLLMKQLEFSQAIARSTDAQSVMNTALQLVLEIAHAGRAEILWLEGKRLVPRVRKVSRGVKRMDEDWTYYADATDAVVRTGEPVYLADTRVEPGYADLPDARAVVALPITDEYQRTGVILALGLPEGELVKRELDALKVLAHQLSATLRNIRMQNEWRERNQRLEMLYMLSSSVTSTLVMAEVLDLVVKLSLEITQADRGFLFLLGDDGALTCEAARHPDGPITDLAHERYSRSICRRVLDTGEALCVEDTLDDDVLKHQKSIQDLNLRTVMCVPLRVKQKYLGVLYVDSRVVVNTFTDRDLELLKSIASHASIALENARLYQLATVDGLTGLYFRSHFEQRMKEEISRAQRYAMPISYMMMDIDHFKKFNDTYGHAVGDQVLRHVAQIIKTNVRTDVDIPSRYGGEEMVVLLPETDAVGAAIFGERIRRAVDEALLEADGHQGLHVTISIGIASLPLHASTGLELMELADQALYASKHGGRNRVTVYSPTPEG